MDHLLVVLVLLWSSGLQAEETHNSIRAQCETTNKADIVVLVDGSGSISQEGFETIQIFIADIVNAFDIGPDRFQIGLTQFSNRPRTEWNLNTHQTKQSLLDAIDKLQKVQGGTFTGRALRHILNNNFKPNVGMRADSKKIAVLITDGEPNDNITLPLQNLKDAGVELYIIGVRDANNSKLMAIVDQFHAYYVRDFVYLLDIVNNVVVKLCNSAVTLGAQCETKHKVDMVVLVDGSGSIRRDDFETIKFLIIRIVDAFIIGPDRVQIGLTQFGTHPRTEWNLNTHWTKQSLLEAIDKLKQVGGGTYTGRALKHILHKIFKPNVGMRADSHKIAVLITGGEAQDNVTFPLQNQKDNGIEVFIIGVKDARMSQLMATTDKSHIYYAWDFRFLLYVANNITISICNSATSRDSVRLVNGTSLCSGRLEVKSNQSNQWSSVCEADFDQQDAEVVCRELGCGAPSVLLRGLYGQVEAQMWTRQFQCGGNESALLNCRRSDSTTTCSPGRAVGLTCSEPMRLMGGSSRCAGTLEVKHRGMWRPANHTVWSLKDTQWVCRELGCGFAVSTEKRDHSLERSIWWISPDCVQSGFMMRECVSSGCSSFTLEIICSNPVVFIIRLVVLLLSLLLFITVICFVHKDH
ncbi:collagen alpha-4(VI) chain-like [Anabas testudineus]|uniref:Uncharacterized protein n=1 Tax=Anabas testudineus TaxID=64144 RepID=A0A7N6ARP1_ANATE|nr:collagen alpha-4(VI) chain-like [Anabas testudineus]